MKLAGEFSFLELFILIYMSLMDSAYPTSDHYPITNAIFFKSPTVMMSLASMKLIILFVSKNIVVAIVDVVCVASCHIVGEAYSFQCRLFVYVNA